MFISSQIDSVFNQFSVIKNIAFLNAYTSNLNWVITNNFLKIKTNQEMSDDFLTLQTKIMKDLLSKITELTFSLKFAKDLFKLSQTTVLFEQLNIEDNCSLLSNSVTIINCSDVTQSTVFKNGVTSYMAYYSIVYQQIIGRFGALQSTKNEELFSKFENLDLQQFLSIRSLVYLLIQKRNRNF